MLGFIKHIDNEKYKNLQEKWHFFLYLTQSLDNLVTDFSTFRLLTRPKLLLSAQSGLLHAVDSSYTDLDLEVCFVDLDLVGRIEG